jgi:hypothetical protein
MTRYHARREDITNVSTFDQYITDHYDSWVKLARNQGCASGVKLIFVSGFDVTKDFAMATYSHNDASLQFDLSISAPTVAAASAHFYKVDSTSPYTYTNRGPQRIPPLSTRILSWLWGLITARDDSDEFNQCVFVRCSRMTKRSVFLRGARKLVGIPKVMKAGARPHNLGPGQNHDATFPESTVQQGPASGHGDGPTGSGGGRITEYTHSDQDIVVHDPPDVWYSR